MDSFDEQCQENDHRFLSWKWRFLQQKSIPAILCSNTAGFTYLNKSTVETKCQLMPTPRHLLVPSVTEVQLCSATLKPTHCWHGQLRKTSVSSTFVSSMFKLQHIKKKVDNRESTLLWRTSRQRNVELALHECDLIAFSQKINWNITNIPWLSEWKELFFREIPKKRPLFHCRTYTKNLDGICYNERWIQAVQRILQETHLTDAESKNIFETSYKN